MYDSFIAIKHISEYTEIKNEIISYTFKFSWKSFIDV
jgi:hypothetical protein